MVRTILLLSLLVLSSSCRFNKPSGEPYTDSPAPTGGNAQLVVYRMADGVGGEDRVDVMSAEEALPQLRECREQ